MQSNGDIQVGWEDISCHGNGTGIIMKDSVTNIQVESYQFPLVEDRDGNNVLRFYWLDAYEDAFNHPGLFDSFVVYFFFFFFNVFCCLLTHTMTHTKTHVHGLCII